MTGCMESSVGLIYQELDQTIERLVPAVEALLSRAANDEAVRSEPVEGGVTITTSLHFPDAIGRGQLVAKLFRYRDAVRLDIEIAHNRHFAKPGGKPSDRRCFLNDFVATTKVAVGTQDLAADFRRQVIAGVRAARHAVQRHNRTHTEPWNQVKVVAAS